MQVRFNQTFSLRKVGGADEKMRYLGDWMLWVKILISDIAFVAKNLITIANIKAL